MANDTKTIPMFYCLEMGSAALQLAGLAGPGCVAGGAGRDTGQWWRRMEKRGRVKT